MYKIGEFSKLTGCSKKTLRYYDELGILNPSRIDNFTNYRYYDENDLEVLKKIIYLKKLGFTLEEIKNNINNITKELLDSKIEELLNKKYIIEEQINNLYLFKDKLINKVKTLK